jgi:hypothetical protein
MNKHGPCSTSAFLSIIIQRHSIIFKCVAPQRHNLLAENVLDACNDSHSYSLFLFAKTDHCRNLKLGIIFNHTAHFVHMGTESSSISAAISPLPNIPIYGSDTETWPTSHVEQMFVPLISDCLHRYTEYSYLSVILC